MNPNRAARPRRLHYLATHANDAALLEKAAHAPVDAVMLDLEDGVPPANKDEARERLRVALATHDWGGRYRIVRVNDLATDVGRADLSLVGARPDAVMLAKIEGPADVVLADELLSQAEAAEGLAPGTTRLYVMLERAAAVHHAYEILTASPRMEGAVFGHADFSAEIGCESIAGDRFVLCDPIIDYAHARVVTAAAAAKVHIVAATMGPLSDLGTHLEQMRRLFARGFHGVLVVTPRHAGLVEEAYRPGDAESAFAQGVVDAFEATLADRNATVSKFHDTLVEGPFLEIASRLLARRS